MLAPPLLAAAIALAACGDSGSPQGEATPGQTAGLEQAPTVTQSRPMTPAEVRVLVRAQRAVDAYCRRVGAALAEGDPPPTEDDYRRVTTALDQLAGLGTRAPGAETVDGTTARLALGDIAENLEATNCDPRLVDRIDATLATLPAI